MIIYGLNPVLEALRQQRVRRLRIGTRSDRRIEELVALARQQNVHIERVEMTALERVARGGVHQGVVADVEAPRDYGIAELVAAAAPDAPLIVVLDGIEDPHNVGAILRTIDAAGAHGMVRQERHSASLDGIVAKASAGAVSSVRIATVVNIARAVEELKEAGVWTVGLASDAPEPYDAVDLTLPTAIVLGAEGTGLRRLVRDRCDRQASIPMRGAVQSLNVSVAAGVVLYEAARQRAAKKRAGGKNS
ncbi:MAG TPA: 23S rRNA (guanosine(2251)-2'-O)-methyltransferase RlmB [Vicinamibacterales bacterium]|nr:23S rRNA (guanosine(2251)-2'-O)-methyltransferase RlmB [Vicinamibacterales bacterium]